MIDSTNTNYTVESYMKYYISSQMEKIKEKKSFGYVFGNFSLNFLDDMRSHK